MDIMEVFKRIDQQGGSLPKFLSDSHADMPPASGFEIISEHLLELINEVASLKEKLLQMNPCDSSRTSNHLTDVKEYIKDIKLLLMDKSEPKTKNQVGNRDPRPSYSQVTNNSSSSAVNSTNNRLLRNAQPSSGRSSSLVLVQPNIPSNAPVSSDSQVNPGIQRSPDSEDSNSNEWYVVGLRRKRNIVKGSRTGESSIKGVQATRELYIGRCDPSVDVEDLRKYIKDTADVTILNCNVLSQPGLHVKSFKVTLKESDVDALMDSGIWPENVYIRKYFNRTRRGNLHSPQDDN